MSDDNQFQKHHLPKPCKFCGRPAPYAPLEEVSRYGMSVYFCHHCQSEYLHYQSGNISGINLYTKINGETYRWSCTPDRKIASLWYIGDPGIPGEKVNKDLQCIRQFDADKGDIFPEMTPQNVEAKIRMLLVFS
jgi:hypothetical protein